MQKTTRRIAIAGVLAIGLGSPAMARSFPTKPVVMIVPFAAGGPSDLIARLLAENMGRTLGQQVVIENVAGAGGTTGAKRLLAAEADGYTMLIHHLALAAAPALYDNLGYDTKTAFAPIGLVNTGPMVVTGKNALAATGGKEFFAFAKSQSDKMTIAHAGVGSNSHLCAVLMSQALGVKFAQVAYRGTGPAMNDLVSGQVDVLCDQSTTAVPQIEGGKIKAFAVTSPDRLDVLKDTPTTREIGVSLDMTIWHGLYAPKGTPTAVLDKLNDALKTALRGKTIAERFQAVGTSPFPEADWSREAHHERLISEIDKWAVALKSAGQAPQATK